MSSAAWQCEATRLASCARDIANSPTHWISVVTGAARGTISEVVGRVLKFRGQRCAGTKVGAIDNTAERTL